MFVELDWNEDRIIKREECIESILLDGECSKLVNDKVLVFNAIDKSITFRQILNVILDDFRKERN